MNEVNQMIKEIPVRVIDKIRIFKNKDGKTDFRITSTKDTPTDEIERINDMLEDEAYEVLK
jgi:hypothetical protein